MNEKLLQLSEEPKRKKILVYSVIALLFIYFVITKKLMKWWSFLIASKITVETFSVSFSGLIHEIENHTAKA